MLLHLPRIATGQWTNERVDDVIALAADDIVGVHGLVDDPDDADVVLFVQCHMVDWRLHAIRNHPVAIRHWNKVMVYDERAIHWRSFPGVYVSTPSRSFDSRTQRAWSYLRIPSSPPTYTAEPDLLFSFVGSATAECRKLLLTLDHPSAVVEEVTGFMFWDTSAPGYEARRARYREILGRSRFVLCPRGTGTSSFRMYEAMAAGRVPVIISDDWVEPAGPDWEAFSVRCPEMTTDGLVELLETLDSRWEEMSAAALAAHNRCFGRRVMFHRFVEQLRTLVSGHASPPSRAELAFRSLGAAFKHRTLRRAVS
jgi:hypothetical protein